MSRHCSWMLLLAAACGAPREIISTGATNAGPAAPAEVTIHAGETQPTTLSWGLVHGLTRNQIGSTNPTPLLRALQPKVWRMSNQPNDVLGYVVTDGQFPLVVGTRIVWNVQDSFLMFQGRNSSSRICVGSAACPTSDAVHFANFADFQAAWRAFLPRFLAMAPRFDWYDVFGEPDLQVIGIAYPDDLVTLYLDAESAIRARYPQAKIVAPSYALFSEKDDNRLVEFVNKLRQRGGSADAISWHEFGAHPGQVVDHAAAARTAACGTSCPELHINEYESGQFTQLPGRQVAWLHYFQVADIQQANRACWDVQVVGGPKFSTCWAGFVGLDLANRHLSGVAAVAAAMGSATNEIRILVGNFGFVDATPLDVVLTGYPHRSDGQVSLTVERIPGIGGSTISRTAQNPDPAVTTQLPVQGRRFVVRFPTVRSGDAYSIVVTPR